MIETRQQIEDRARTAVEMAGGVFQGIQHVDGLPNLEDIVLFAWHRLGTTLALPVSRITVENVRAKMEGTYSASRNPNPTFEVAR